MVLVYDLGGGTFDVSLVELMGGIVEVRASHGNTQLGGDDFDQLLAEQIANWFDGLHGVDLRQDRRAWARLLRAAETAKIQLSTHPYTWIKKNISPRKTACRCTSNTKPAAKISKKLIQPCSTKPWIRSNRCWPTPTSRRRSFSRCCWWAGPATFQPYGKCWRII